MPEAMEKIRREVEKSLRKSHPEWSEEKIKSISYATAWKTYQHSKGGK